MKRIFVFALLGALLVGIRPESSFAQNVEAYPSYIEVNGSAEKEVAPDVFYLRIEINEQNSKGKKSVEEQQKSMLSALKSLGIDIEKQLVRTSLSSSFYNRRTNLSTATYQLKVNTAEAVSSVWQRLDGLGISDVSFIKAEYSKIEELKDQVRQEAVRNAKKQAESMAGAIGQTVGKCFYINGGYSGNSVLYAQPRMAAKGMMMDYAVEEAAVEESIEFDNIKVSQNISAKFVLE